MSRPTLSVCLTTRNSADRLAWWFERVRPYADEIVVAVDATSTDDTLEVAASRADVVTSVELAGFAEPSRDWLLQRASGDWALVLDDDEALSQGAQQMLEPLLADRRYTSYGLPVRWVVSDAGGRLAWLHSHPWHSAHWQLLFRNIPGLYYAPGALHTTPLVLGHSRALPPVGPLALYHLDLLWNTRSGREAKVARYHRIARPGGPTADEHYLYEDYRTTLELAPLPTGEDFPTGFPPRSPSPKGVAPSPITTHAELQAHLSKRAGCGHVVQ